MKLSLLLALALGCAGSEAPPVEEPPQEPVEDPPPSEEQLLEFGWISEAVLDPVRFTALTERSRDGWVALHAHDYHGAIRAFGDDATARARAEFALGVLYDDLAITSGLANEQLFTEWDKREGLPKGNHAPLVAALAAWCTSGDTIGTWASRVKDERGPGYGVSQALVQGRSALDGASADPFGRRLELHRQVRDGAVEALTKAALRPMASVEEPKFTREYWDPCVWSTLSQHWLDTTGRSLGGTNWRSITRWSQKTVGLEGRLFAPWLGSEDLEADLALNFDEPTVVGARSPRLRKLGVGTDAFAADEPEDAREEVRNLDAGLDSWSRKLRDQAGPDGVALLDDLQLVARFRQEWLVTRARAALDNKRPRMALTYLELARDSAEKGVGPTNSPALFALFAQSQLRLGHTREALDALYVLTDAYPEAFGLKEVVSDLAVLQGLDRQGDSKEN